MTEVKWSLFLLLFLIYWWHQTWHYSSREGIFGQEICLKLLLPCVAQSSHTFPIPKALFVQKQLFARSHRK